SQQRKKYTRGRYSLFFPGTVYRQLLWLVHRLIAFSTYCQLRQLINILNLHPIQQQRQYFECGKGSLQISDVTIVVVSCIKHTGFIKENIDRIYRVLKSRYAEVW